MTDEQIIIDAISLYVGGAFTDSTGIPVGGVKLLMQRAFTAGQAAERQRIEAAPRAWVCYHDNGTVIGFNAGDRLPGTNFTEVALVPLSPTPQQESGA